MVSAAYVRKLISLALILSISALLYSSVLKNPAIRISSVSDFRWKNNEHQPCNNYGEWKGPILPAVRDHDDQLSACDLSKGLGYGHRCDLQRGYTFFTFDPSLDLHVSQGMLQTGGLYDSHVHVALDFALSESGADLQCTPGSIVLDVGSNLGTLALYAAAMGCKTHAFEIQPEVACRLQMSITASNLDVTLHRKAVHSEAGKELTFGNIPNNPGGVGIVDGGQDSTRSVKSVRLDDVFGASSDIVFMKVDTEGNEFHVLKSAENLLSGQQIKYMVVEVRPSQVEMVNYLYEYGYTCSLIRDARSREAVTCRSTSLENLLIKLQRVEAFSDMFCCIGVPKNM